MYRFSRALWSRAPSSSHARWRARHVLGGALALATAAAGYKLYQLETHATVLSRDCEPALPRRYRYRLARIEDEAGRESLQAMLDRCWRLWQDASADSSLSSAQLAAVATPAAMQCLWDGHEAQARAIAGGALRALLRTPRATLRPVDRLRAVACALVLSVCDQEAESWWPFLAWASAEMCDAAVAEDAKDGEHSPAFMHWKGVAYCSVAGWAAGAYNPVLFDILPLYAATYEHAFLHDEYLAADIANELARGFITRGLYPLARLCLEHAFWLGRVGYCASRSAPDGEPDAGFRTRLLTILLIGNLEEWTEDLHRAQQWYGAARALMDVHPHRARALPARYAHACAAGLLRVRVRTNTLVLFAAAADDFDEDEGVGGAFVW